MNQKFYVEKTSNFGCLPASITILIETLKLKKHRSRLNPLSLSQIFFPCSQSSKVNISFDKMTICNVSWCWTLFGRIFSNWVQSCRDPTNRRSCKKQSLPHTILDNLSLDIQEQLEVGRGISNHAQTFRHLRLAGVYRRGI